MTIRELYLVVFSNMADLEFYQDDSDENADDGYGFDGGLGGEVEDLTPLQKLERYLVSDNMFNRQMLARGLLDTLRAVHDHDDDCMAVLEAMARLSEDPEPSVRSELMEQVPHIAVYCQENRESFASAVPQYILPMVVRYLNDSNGQVRKTSQAALLVLMEQSLVEKSDVESQVVKVILELAASESSDDYRSEAAALMSKMAPLLGKSITERHFLPRFSEMCTDPLFHVRKVCAANFGEVSNVVGIQNCEEVLLPKFYCLCEDGVWGVRKACAECFMTVSCACSLETRRNELANLFVNLLCDQSRWVRMSAFQHLGPFISTFADSDETGFYVNENGHLTTDTLESFSIEECDSDESHEANLQGILQLKSLDSPQLPSKSFSNNPVSSAEKAENVEEESDVSEIHGEEEAMEIVDCESLSEDYDSSESSNCSEVSLEELRAMSLSEKKGGGDATAAPPQGESEGEDSSAAKSQGDSVDPICDNNSSSNQRNDTACSLAPEDDSTSIAALSDPHHHHQSDISINKLVDSSVPENSVLTSDDDESSSNEPLSVVSSSSSSSSLSPRDESQNSSNLTNEDHCDAFATTTTSPTVIAACAKEADVDPTPSSVHQSNSDNNNTTDDVTFNNFLYWRQPLPDVQIDFDLLNSKPADIHHVAKRTGDEDANADDASSGDESRDSNSLAAGASVSETNVNVSCSFSSSHSSINSSSTTKDSMVGAAVEESLANLSPYFNGSSSPMSTTIHTASVNTVADESEETVNIGSTHVLGQHFGERHFAVVDGVMQDLSPSIGFMDDLPSLLLLDDATLAMQQNIVPQLLLENYLGMVDPSRAQTVDGDITRHCAYNLPAVAYTLGRRNWHCIKQLYETLAQDMQWKVRRTLAFSIHELALIVGDEITHKDLVPIFDGFLKDLDEVRIGVLKHLFDIFKLLRPNVRILYLSRVQDFMKTDNTRNWRFREELAEQLIQICDLFDCVEIVEHIVPLSLVLCMDKVAQVRTMALRLLSSILLRTQYGDEKKLLASICNDLIEKFATNNRWLGRQTFAQLCYVILEEDSLPPEVFARNLLPSLLALSTDPVANVRLCLARVLSERITPLEYFTSQSNPHHSDLLETLHKLRMDGDKDVRYFSSQQPKTELSQHHQTVPV